MYSESKGKKVTFELLKKYGAKWAVLAAMKVDLMKKGANIPSDISKEIELSNVKISSGCFSSCDAHCDLSKIEGSLVSIGANFGDTYMDQWFDLISQAMAGEIDSQKISKIPLLKPIETRCDFLECAC